MLAVHRFRQSVWLGQPDLGELLNLCNAGRQRVAVEGGYDWPLAPCLRSMQCCACSCCGPFRQRAQMHPA
jgi:hypothetical protein